MLVELGIHGHHVDGRSQDGAQHLIRADLPPVFGVLQAMLFYVGPDLLDHLQGSK